MTLSENVIYCIANMLLPVTLLMLGLVIWRTIPPYGSILGYKTSRSVKNPTLWDSAQHYFGKNCTITYTVLSVITLTAVLASIFGTFDEKALVIICTTAVIVNVAALFTVIGIVECKLKKIEHQNSTNGYNTNRF